MMTTDIGLLVQEVLDGNASPLDAYATLKELAKEISAATKEIEEVALAEAETYGQNKFEAIGYNFEIRSGRRMHSFKHIPEWVELNQSLKEKEAMYKSATAAAERGNVIVDEVGEVIQPAQVTYSKASLSVSKA